jgi:hypothetical protein
MRKSIAGLLSVMSWVAAAWAGEPDPKAAAFFEKEVRPLLAENCYGCHGDDKQKGGLRLDSLEALLRGGDSGPALVPGKPGESLLIEAVHHDGLAMPPKGRLAEEKVRTLERWVELGAPWPNAGHATTPGAPVIRRSSLTDEDRAYWFFQPLAESGPPEIDDGGWSRNPIDRFILARLRAAGLTPSAEADPRTLIRRLTFDLTGLPPTPEEVEAFVHSKSPIAYEELVNRLLASPRFGERQARRWLDLVRYAESDGYRQDAYRPHAWPYRDYAIRSFNSDKPYDQFLREQIAGDEIDPSDPELRVAAGYYRLGTYEFNQRDVPGQWRAILDDVTDVTAEVVLGLGMGCARCHDHKFDPILQEDYYRLQAFFTPLYHRNDLTAARPEEAADRQVARAAWELATAPVRERIAELERPAREAAMRDAVAKFPPETQAILHKPEADRTPRERQLAELAFRQVTEEWTKIGEKLKGDAKAEWEAQRKRLAEWDAIRPPSFPGVMTVRDVGPVAPPTVIPGDRASRDIAPGMLAVLGPGLASMPTITPRPNSTGRRSALAEWMTRPDNPMTTRVMVNRLWQDHFGQGLVGTSSDFGRLGEPPTHPELLDWLARYFVEEGWSLKALHRLIVTSATYRQAAAGAASDAPMTADPEVRLLWKMVPRRLEAEAIRDAMLAVSGELDPSGAGPAVAAEKPRRTVYTRAIRNTRDELLEAFDAPDASLSTARRNTTVTPTQALLLVNGPWSLARASRFAARLSREHPDNIAAQVDRGFRLAFGRPPTDDERADALAFLDRPGGAEANLIDFCHALLNANEFLTVD